MSFAIFTVRRPTYHLLFSYPFSNACWNHLGIHWDHSLDFFLMISAARE